MPFIPSSSFCRLLQKPFFVGFNKVTYELWASSLDFEIMPSHEWQRSATDLTTGDFRGVFSARSRNACASGEGRGQFSCACSLATKPQRCFVDLTDFYILVNDPYNSSKAREAQSFQLMTQKRWGRSQLKSYRRRQNNSHFLSLKSGGFFGRLHLNLSPTLTLAVLFRWPALIF